jgi:hypothetical protein
MMLSIGKPFLISNMPACGATDLRHRPTAGFAARVLATAACGTSREFADLLLDRLSPWRRVPYGRFPVMAKEYKVAERKKTRQRRSSKLQKLIHQRNRLRKELSNLDRLIVEIGGVVRDGHKSMRRRPKNAKTSSQR